MSKDLNMVRYPGHTDIQGRAFTRQEQANALRPESTRHVGKKDGKEASVALAQGARRRRVEMRCVLGVWARWSRSVCGHYRSQQ